MGEWKRAGHIYPIVFFLMMVFLLPGNDLQVNATEQIPKEQLSSYSDTSELIADTWDDSYFGKIVLDTDTGEMEKDGQPINDSREFGWSSSEKKAVTKSEDSLEEYLNKQDEEIYETETNEDGDIEITAPFQTKRLIVDGEFKEFCGANKVYYNEEEKETILQFDTQENTREAYERICGLYGDEVCQPDQVYYIDDILMDNESGDVSFTSWGNGYMGMNHLKSSAFSRGYNKTVTVAVLDTGIDRSNIVFSGRKISSKSYNFTSNTNNITDVHGHGTHVSGIIADATPNNVQILMLKIANSQGYSSLLTIKTALQYAVKQKADVINMSIGFISLEAYKCTYLDSIIDTAYDRGIPIVTAAGNNSVNVNYCYPACNSKTIAVSAIDMSGNIAYYSNRGAKIDFCAPGSEVISAGLQGGKACMSGTSMAAPHISASIAYLKMMQSNLSVKGIYQELKLYCKDLGSRGKDSSYGWGCPVLSGLFNKGITYRTQIVSPVSSPKIKSLKNEENGIRISWQKVTGATKYMIYRKNVNGKYTKIGTVSAKNLSYLDKKVVQGKQYIYGIKTVKSNKNSGLGSPKNIVRLKTITKTNSRAAKGRKVLFSWKKQKGVTGYQIRLGGQKNLKKYQTLTVTKNVQKTLKKNLKKKTYYFRIRSYRKIGKKTWYSPWSSLGRVRVH